jgi:RNA polymerase sigma-70 factor (ECF subfamily)
MARRAGGEDELAGWLADGYGVAFRTAYGLLGNRVDAEDAVQEAFLRAWRFRAAVPGDGGVGPWMYRVVVNACLSKLRQDGRRRAHTAPPGEGDIPWAPDADGDPLVAAVAGEARSVVLDALGALPEHLRVVVVLRYYAGLGEREIAQVIHRRPGTVKSRLHAARAQLGGNERLGQLATEPVDAGTGTGGR